MPPTIVELDKLSDLKREGFHPIDNVSVVLTHLSEVIRNNLPQLLSYKDMRALIDRLDPEYKRLVDDIKDVVWATGWVRLTRNKRRIGGKRQEGAGWRERLRIKRVGYARGFRATR